jgi:hypothetical protein
MWRRIAAAAVTIVLSVEAAANLRMLTDPRLLPAQCRLFRRMVAAVGVVVVLVAVVEMPVVAAVVVAVVANDIESSANRA